MTERSQDRSWSAAAASVRLPDALHIDLPPVDQEDICFYIDTCLIRITSQHWELMADGFVTCAMITMLASSCIDIIQTFAQAILDDVLPQVLSYARTYGTFSPTVLGLSADRIRTYLGDSIEHALANFLKTATQNTTSTKVFSELLLGHISEAVNSVLALSTQTPIPASRLPVFFVSGCVTSVGQLRDLVCHIAIILMRALDGQQLSLGSTEVESGHTTLCEPSEEVDTLLFCLNSRDDLKQAVKANIIRMVKVLKGIAQVPGCKMISRSHGDICIRVGTNVKILTVEDMQSNRPTSAMSAFSGWDVLPGTLLDSDDANSQASGRCHFGSVTVISPTQDHSQCLDISELESIKKIAEELVQALLEEDPPGPAQTDSCQRALPGGLEDIDGYKLRELTERIFRLVMGGRNYQIPLLPAGTRMCDTVTFRRLRRGETRDPGLVAQALYMRTEEVVARSALQVLLWSALYPEGSEYPSPVISDDRSEELDFVLVQSQAAGDCFEDDSVAPAAPFGSSSALSQDTDDTYNLDFDPAEATQSQLLAGIAHTSLLTLLVGEMLTTIGIRSSTIIYEMGTTVVEQLQDVDPTVYQYFHATLMGRSYKEIYQTVINDLLLEFGSVQILEEMATSEDPYFEEALLRALRKQLKVPSPPTENAAQKITYSFLWKCKRLCCKKNSEPTTVITLNRDQDDDHFSKEPPEDHQEEGHCPLMSRICAATRYMFSVIAKTVDRPFVACCGAETQQCPSIDETLDKP